MPSITLPDVLPDIRILQFKFPKSLEDFWPINGNNFPNSENSDVQEGNSFLVI